MTTDNPGKLTEDQLRELGREAERERWTDRYEGQEDFGRSPQDVEP